MNIMDFDRSPGSERNEELLTEAHMWHLEKQLQTSRERSSQDSMPVTERLQGVVSGQTRRIIDPTSTHAHFSVKMLKAATVEGRLGKVEGRVVGVVMAVRRMAVKLPRPIKLMVIGAGWLLLLALVIVVGWISAGATLLPDASHLLGRVRLQRLREVPRSHHP